MGCKEAVGESSADWPTAAWVQGHGRAGLQTEAGWRGLGALDQGVRTLFSTQREPRSIWCRGAIQSKLLSEAGFRVPIA